MEKKRPLTREEYFCEKSSMTAPMVFTIETNGKKKRIFAAKDKYMEMDVN